MSVGKCRIRWSRLLIAVVLTFLAAACRAIFLTGMESHAPFVTFFPAVALAALLGGFFPGLIATIFSAALVDYFWLEPAGFGISHPADLLGFGSFFISCLIISFLAEATHRANDKAHAAQADARLAAELRKCNDELEARVCARTAELSKSRDQLKLLASELVRAEENERKRIAQEIHDGLSSQLAAIRLHAELSFCRPQNAESGNEAIGQLTEMISQAIEETRRIMTNLRPAMLDDLGLLPTLDWSCRAFQKLNPMISPELEIQAAEEDVPDCLKTVIFRLLQETLNNVRNHSRADRVLIELKKTDSAIIFSINDNGQGFSNEQVQTVREMGHGFGLRGIRERVELTGGKCKIESVPGQGVTVWAEWETNEAAELGLSNDPARSKASPTK